MFVSTSLYFLIKTCKKLFIYLTILSGLNSKGQTFIAYIDHSGSLPLFHACPNDVNHYTIKHNIPALEVKSLTNTEWEVTNGEIVSSGDVNDDECSIRWFD